MDGARAQCGARSGLDRTAVSDRWPPMSLVTGRLDAFQWKAGRRPRRARARADRAAAKSSRRRSATAPDAVPLPLSRGPRRVRRRSSRARCRMILVPSRSARGTHAARRQAGLQRIRQLFRCWLVGRPAGFHAYPRALFDCSRSSCSCGFAPYPLFRRLATRSEPR